jgi:membrane associated rhomboid family serine protease
LTVVGARPLARQGAARDLTGEGGGGAGPWGPIGGEGSEPRREPLVKAPWPVVALIAVLVSAHAARLGLGVDADRFALTGRNLAAGQWTGLVSHIFVHASWAHVIMNTLFVLAFGTPVARFFRTEARGAATFLAFFVVCGVLAGGAYAILIQILDGVGIGPGAAGRGAWAMVGASGAASGLMGAAARLIEGRGRLGPLTGRTVTGMTLAWILVNAILGLSGFTPGAAGAPVAWEAHIFGYFAGLFLVAPFALAAGLDRTNLFTKR